MNTKNKILLTAAALTISGGTWLSSTQAFAQTPVADNNHMSSMVQTIADKFGLNKDEVQAVFDQSREEMEGQRQVAYESRLTQLVSDGKITEAQKQLIMAKKTELRMNRQNNFATFQDKTQEERRAAMATERAALVTWAEENGIDATYLMLGQGWGPGKQGRSFRMHSAQ